MQKNNYVSIATKDDNTIIVWERSSHKEPRKAVLYKPPRYFFVPDEVGEFNSMYGDKLKKLSFENDIEFKAAKKLYPITLESDFSSEDRVLMDFYYNIPPPPVNTAFWDIESLVTKGQSFVKPKDATAPINAITLYKMWEDRYITLAVPPPGTSTELFDIDLTEYGYKNVNLTLKLFRTEAELLNELLDIIEDVDLLSGWNSENYDLPYTYNRILKVLGENAVRQLNFPGTKKAFIKDKVINGREEINIELRGRQHVDYLDMFKKFTFGGRESYSLNSIAETELDVKKLEYEGNLGDLYRNEFKKFVAYNIIDVVLIKMIDDKFKFVNILNQMAHENTVKFGAILGTTKYIDTGISNFAINELNLRVKDCPSSSHGKVEGAIVLTPNVGLHEWVGSVDINSLYPSVIRSLNLSPEKIIGQFDTAETQIEVENDFELKPLLKQSRKKGVDTDSFVIAAARERDWAGITARDNKVHTLHLEYGDIISLTGNEWYQFLREMNWAISAFGTVLDQSGSVGIVAQVLGFWYTERKRLQKELSNWKKKLEVLEKEKVLDLQAIKEAKINIEHFDLLQYTKKIQLNSAYGALLAKGFRYGAGNIGASVTYTGRAITTFMDGSICELLSGKFVNLEKSHGIDAKGEITNIYKSPDANVLYGDTDSSYFKTGATNKEDAIEIADAVAEGVNDKFQGFMKQAFNCQPGFDDLIVAGREVVASRALLQARKKYMMRIVNLDGYDCDKFKAVGSEIKKSDTPKIIQKTLKNIVDLILDGIHYDEVAKYVNETRKKLFKGDLEDENIIQFGASKSANNIEIFTEAYGAEILGKPILKEGSTSKLTIPGHVRSAINYNMLVREYEGPGGLLIGSGDKVRVFEIKPNEYGFKAIAIPAESSKFPEWFTDNFSVDLKTTEEKLIDAKLKGIFAAINEEVPTPFLSRVRGVMKF
jgi:DNA polymerase elongation subunit (family B)